MNWVALPRRHCIEYALVDPLRERLGDAQRAAAFVRQLHGVGARVGLGAPALQEALGLQAPHDVGQGRPIDACVLDESRLTEAFGLRHRQQDGELARGQVAVLHLGVEDVAGTLPGAMQKMDGRMIQLIGSALAGHGAASCGARVRVDCRRHDRISARKPTAIDSPVGFA
jgi:hypothetical protein